jgi:uncharacterized protein Yka (UPF0111/DUF47 family)
LIYKALRKQDAFFSVFNSLAALATEAATELRRLFASLPLQESDAETMTLLESRGDKLLVDLNLQLAQTFITPLDREDIHRLATGLKGVLDTLHGAAHRAVYFKADKAPPDALEMIDLAGPAITAIGEALLCLQSGKSVAHLRQIVTDCERRADKLSRRAIGRMFEDRLEVYELLKWKELYERLESLLDRCEDAFDIVETLGVKYA